MTYIPIHRDAIKPEYVNLDPRADIQWHHLYETVQTHILATYPTAANRGELNSGFQLRIPDNLEKLDGVYGVPAPAVAPEIAAIPRKRSIRERLKTMWDTRVPRRIAWPSFFLGLLSASSFLLLLGSIMGAPLASALVGILLLVAAVATYLSLPHAQ